MKTRPHPLRGGGVGIYISKQHKFELINNVNESDMYCLEVIGAKVTIDNYVVKILLHTARIIMLTLLKRN